MQIRVSRSANIIKFISKDLKIMNVLVMSTYREGLVYWFALWWMLKHNHLNIQTTVSFILNKLNMLMSGRLLHGAYHSGSYHQRKTPKCSQIYEISFDQCLPELLPSSGLNLMVRKRQGQAKSKYANELTFTTFDTINATLNILSVFFSQAHLRVGSRNSRVQGGIPWAYFWLVQKVSLRGS